MDAQARQCRVSADGDLRGKAWFSLAEVYEARKKVADAAGAFSNGMAAARGRLYVSTTGGQVVSMSGESDG